MYDSSSPLDDNYGNGTSLSSNDAANLRNAGKWARFIAIFSMVGLGIVLVGLLVGGSTVLATLGIGEAGGAAVGMMITYGLAILFGVYMTYLQYQFGNQAMQAVDRQDAGAMSDSLAALSRYYKIYGVIMAIYLGMVGIGLIFAVVGGVFAVFG